MSHINRTFTLYAKIIALVYLLLCFADSHSGSIPSIMCDRVDDSLLPKLRETLVQLVERAVEINSASQTAFKQQLLDHRGIVDSSIFEVNTRPQL